jgi:hypothetical protein
LLADALEKVAAVAALLHAQVADGADGGGGFGDNKGLSAFFAALEIKY